MRLWKLGAAESQETGSPGGSGEPLTCGAVDPGGSGARSGAVIDLRDQTLRAAEKDRKANPGSQWRSSRHPGSSGSDSAAQPRIDLWQQSLDFHPQRYRLRRDLLLNRIARRAMSHQRFSDWYWRRRGNSVQNRLARTALQNTAINNFYWNFREDQIRIRRTKAARPAK